MRPNESRCILFVENDGIRTRELADQLERFNYRVTITSDLSKAVERYRTDEDIDMVLMDLGGEGGHTAVRAAKDMLRIRAVPIVFRSPRYEPEDWKTIEEVPHYGCVLKGSGDAALPSILDTAFRLFTARQETRDGEEKYRKHSAELVCLSRLLEIFCDGKRTLETLLRDIAAVLPCCLRYPDAARARIVLEGREHGPDSFKETPWKAAADIRVAGRKSGSVEIVYLEPVPVAEADCFLENEKIILYFAAMGIGSFVEHLRDEEALRRSETLIRTVMDNLPIGIAVNFLDSAVDFLYVNDNFRRIYRMPSGTPFRADAFWESAFTDPVFREEIRKRVMTDIATGDPERMQWRDVPITREGEETTYISAKNILIPGKQLMISTVWDVTGQKAAGDKLHDALREKEIMMKEIHHRVKNNMQVISSLLRLQAWRIPDRQLREVFQSCQDRIRSMALIHEKLYHSSSLSCIDFGDYVRDLVDRLFLLSGDSVDSVSPIIDVEGVNLDVNRAIPCGLIINELVTNALKHAFPNGGPGTVRLFMRPVPDNRFQMVVGDNGKGLPENIDIRNPPTLGLQIVRDLICQLNGHVIVDRSHGTVFTIGF